LFTPFAWAQIVSYVLYYSTEPIDPVTTDLALVDTVSTSESFIALHNLAPATEYHFFATTTNAVGLEQTTTVSYRFSTDPLSESTLTLKKGEERLFYSTMNVEFEIGERHYNILNYTVHFRPEDDPTSTSSVTSADPKITLKNLAKSTVYVLSAQATNSMGLVQRTSEYKFETDAPRTCAPIDFVVDKDAISQEACHSVKGRKVVFLQRNTTQVYGTADFCEGGGLRPSYLDCEYLVRARLKRVYTRVMWKRASEASISH